MAIDTVVIDIEGTVAPIVFVKEVLFPYFSEKVPEYLKKVPFPPNKDTSDSVEQILLGLPEDKKASSDDALEYLLGLVKADIKDPVLKALQGFIWKTGYENGELKAPVYADSIKFIREFPKGDEKRIFVYSSGSIKAQILLFGYVDDNGKSVDLNEKLAGYFDLTTGFKNDVSSYEKILKEISRDNDAQKVLFLSDNVNEVKAAIGAGLQSYIVRRPGNAPLTEEDISTYKVIDSLDELDLLEDVNGKEKPKTNGSSKVKKEKNKVEKPVRKSGRVSQRIKEALEKKVKE